MENRTRISRKRAQTMQEVIEEYISSMKLTAGLNTHRIFSAWNDASGAERYTIKRYFRDGKLYITLNSSVVRSQLHFQEDAILEKINAILKDDVLFTKNDPKVSYVKELILK